MEERSYIRYLPSQASEPVRRWAEEHRWHKELLVYRAGRRLDPLTGLTEKCVDATCSVCGRTMKLDYAPGPECSAYAGAPFGFWYGVDRADTEAYQTGSDLLCPCCGAQVRAAHIGQAEWAADEYEWVMEPMRIPAEWADMPAPLVLMFWRVHRWINKKAEQCLSAAPWEAYIVEDKKIVRCAHWQGGFGGRVYSNVEWRQCKTFRDEIGDIEHVVGSEGLAEVLVGTTAENSKLDLYMGLKAVKFPVAYLRLWLWHRNVETLLTAGAGELVAGLILEDKEKGGTYRRCYSTLSPRLVEVNWKAKRPSQMLRMTREELRAAVKGKLTPDGLKNWMAARAGGLPVKMPEDIQWLNKLDVQEGKRILAHGQMPDRAERYLAGQIRRYPAEKTVLNLRTLADYWDLAKGQRLDMTDRDVLWPAHLMRAHDQVVMNGEFKESSALCMKFARRYKQLLRYQFSADGLMIRPPTQERELLMEGKVLNHCVASYAKRHAQGETTILFIRREDDPEMPFYTLELAKDGTRVIQNHGRKNCLQTPQVKAFEERWLAWVLAGCKRDKKGRPVEPAKNVARESA